MMIRDMTLNSVKRFSDNVMLEQKSLLETD